MPEKLRFGVNAEKAFLDRRKSKGARPKGGGDGHGVAVGEQRMRMKIGDGDAHAGTVFQQVREHKSEEKAAP
ncbi:MAG: hypothetical protein NVS9B4_18360 [Candidatus Acidiferrum sp.]